ncbi:DUF192 domain-containing protein [Haloglomus litoreum]|uniref:DUF192 domain-containing protein n=1 Tax=Haloglomus litoreum TaxID=3034026 RepID=UPI0023E77DF3|nr:DUF192 domain-containing protein [Haloglomus sp. DT116]
MDTRRVAMAVVLVGLVAAVLTVGTQGLLAPLLTTDGYHPPNSTAAPASGNGTAGSGSGGAQDTSTPVNSDYQHATVVAVDAETGDELGRVRAAVAESYRQKYTGLSETEFLPKDRGMLFPYDGNDDHTYVMRKMSFGIDIVYVAANGTITRIHHAEEPPEGADGNDYEYPGYGQYVLEVNYDWTTRHNVTVGDEVRIEGYGDG